MKKLKLPTHYVNMSTTWNDIVGDFATMKTNAFITGIGKVLYLLILKHRDTIFNDTGLDEDPYSPAFEDFEQAMNPKEKGAKYTYSAQVKDKKTGVTVTKEMNVKKFVMINGDAKYGITFLINLYFKEVLDCFNEDNEFRENCITQLAEYSENTSNHHLAAIAIKTCDLFDVEKLMPGEYGNISAMLFSKAKPHFANCPEDQLKHIIEYLVKFLKAIMILLTDILWEKRQSVTLGLIIGTLRQIFRFLAKDCSVDSKVETFAKMKEWVAESTPAPKKRASKKTPAPQESKKEETPTKEDEKPNEEVKTNKEAIQKLDEGNWED